MFSETNWAERTRMIVFALLGLAMLASTFFTARSTVAFLSTASRASGIVSALIAGGSHPQITFQTESGQQISYTQGGLIWGFAPGDAVTVLYATENPAQTATIDEIGAIWFSAIVQGLIGTMMLAVVLSSALVR